MKNMPDSSWVGSRNARSRPASAAWLALFLVLTVWVAACSPNPLPPTPDPLQATIQVLHTEQAILQRQLDEMNSFPVTPLPSPTTVPTHTPRPSPTRVPVSNNLLPRSIYFLRPDDTGIDQVYRLESDGKTLLQLTFEPTPVQDYDITPAGDLAYIRRSLEDTVQLVIVPASSGETIVAIELTGAGSSLQYLRWLPGGTELVFQRIAAPESAETPTPQVESPAVQELVLYNRFTTAVTVLLRAGTDPLEPVTASVYTDESLAFAAARDLPPSYQVTAISPDGRYLLVRINDASFWLVYDLRLDSAHRLNIAALSADFSPDGQTVCQASNTFQPDFHPPQALLCANPAQNSVDVRLSNPPWQPFAIDYWPEQNAMVFLQRTQQTAGLNVVDIYGLNLDAEEPLLVRSEPFVFGEADLAAQVLFAPQENQDQGLVLLTGQALVMGTPGVVLLPLDPDKQPIYLSGLGILRQPRWGPLP